MTFTEKVFFAAPFLKKKTSFAAYEAAIFDMYMSALRLAGRFFAAAARDFEAIAEGGREREGRMSDDSSSLTTGFIQSEESGGEGHLLYTCILTRRVSSRDDLHELLRDLRLAGAVHLLLQAALELLGVVRRGLHRRHARRELRGHGLLQRPEELAVQVERQDRVQELRGLLLEDHVRHEVLGLRHRYRLLLDRDVAILRRQLEDLVLLHLHARWQQRDQRTNHGLRGNHRDEGSVQQLDAVKLAGVVGGEDLFRDLLGLLRHGRLAAVVRFANPRLATLEVGAALGANADELDLHALGLERSDALLSLLDRRRVVGPAEPAVAGDADETDLLHRAVLEERDVEAFGLHALQQAPEDALKGLREGPRPKHRLLRPAHLGRRHELHGRGDLPRVLRRGDAGPQLEDGGTHLRVRDARRRDCRARRHRGRRQHHLRGRGAPRRPRRR